MPEETESKATLENETPDQLSDADLRQLTAMIYKMILDDLKIERERRG